MAAGLTDDLFVIEAAYGRIKSAEENAWLRVDCPSCAGTQAMRIAYTQENSERPNAIWARCVNCFEGLVVNNGWVSPSSKPLKAIKGLDIDTAAACGVSYDRMTKVLRGEALMRLDDIGQGQHLLGDLHAEAMEVMSMRLDDSN